MSEDVECVVIGAGVIGLAIARGLALAGRQVLLLECAETFGTVTSSRNSEVIHAGLYYPRDSLKARLCVQGRELLYAYCAERGIAHQRCEKLVVAQDAAEAEALHRMAGHAAACGVDDLRHLSAAEATALEPALRCHTALLSPSTGILDSHGYMLSLLGDLENAGGIAVFRTPVLGGKVSDHGLRLRTGGSDPLELRARLVVNAAGLAAQQVASSLEGLPTEAIPRRYLAKGCYFSLLGAAPFQRLVYPLPTEAFLGLHYTRDLAGQGRFGPDVAWIEQEDYTVETNRVADFCSAIRRYWPDLQAERLAPAYAGIRPKLQAPGEPAKDFAIDDQSVHGVQGLVNLFGIESPGLTASLALAKEVVSRMAQSRR